jgi:GNAT superfamily N-acetyltransferase
MTGTVVRTATEADLETIAAIAVATGQDEEWGGADPAYVRHLLQHGRVVVAGRGGRVAGFGATRQIRSGGRAVTMLCDLFVDPGAQGGGCGRAMLAELWGGAALRMTFSSLHANALPLYTSFGVDAWWPLLYLSGAPAAVQVPEGWSAERSAPGTVAALELEWTGADRAVDHRAWAARPAGASLLVRRDGEPAASGTAGGAGASYGLTHLALPPAVPDGHARDVVLAAVGSLEADSALVCLPAPHPAVRALLAAGWRAGEFDLFMASDPGLLDPRRAVPSPALA